MKAGKILTFGALLLSMGLASQTASAVEYRAATFDLQLALDKTQSKDSTAAAEKEFAKLIKENEEEEKALTKLIQDYQTKASNSANSNDKKLTDQEKALTKRIQDFQKKSTDLQARILKKKQEILVPLFTELKKIITKVAKEKNFSMVVEKSQSGAILYSSDEFDITKEVIARFNKQGGTVNSSKSE